MGLFRASLSVASGEVLQKLADLGITLLLFTVGLKLNLKMLLRPQVWAVTGLHIGLAGQLSLEVLLTGLLLVPLVFTNLPSSSAC